MRFDSKAATRKALEALASLSASGAARTTLHEGNRVLSVRGVSEPALLAELEKRFRDWARAER
jgi:hypothetical protein